MKKLLFSKKSIIVTIATGSVLGIVGIAIALSSVSLGTANSFSVLAGSGITATNPSTVSGDIGTFPTTTETGTITVGGTNHAGDATTQGAKTDLTTAYLNAQGQTTPSVTALVDNTTDSFAGTGYTLAPGIYKSANQIGVPVSLTLNGSATDVWIFQAPSTLTTATNANIAFTGGAQACNVFWQVGSSATLGTGTLFKGNILAYTSITDNGGSTIQGRLLASNGAVTLNNTNIVNATCVTSTPAPVVSGGTPAPLPLIDIIKIPSPLALPSGPGSVTFNYTVTNVGKVAMSDVTVTDDKCSPVNIVTGDTNRNGMLDVGKSWTYSCTKTVTKTETNTATARGSAFGSTAYDTANATVVVKASLVPPLIHVVKVPNKFLLPLGGGAVTYTYTVTNPGTVPLSNVSITDNKCTGLPGRVLGHPGDLNHNNLLENNEVWQFTCLTNLTKTTTNIATAEGQANGLTAIDYAQATVVVAVPGLPNTGFAPEDKSLMNILIPAGVVTLLLSLYVARRKYTV